MLVTSVSSSAVLAMISRKSVFMCNLFHARLVDSSEKRAFGKGHANLMPPYGRLLEHRGSKLKLLQSTFNAKNFVRRLSSAIQSQNVCRSLKSRKINY